MPPKIAREFTQNTVTALVAQILRSSGSGKTSLDYKLMSALDGKRSPSSFEHEFREIVRDAKALNDQDGEAKPAKRRSTPKSSPAKSAAGSKRKASSSVDDDDEDHDAIGKHPGGAKKARVSKDKSYKLEAELDSGKDVGLMSVKQDYEDSDEEP